MQGVSFRQLWPKEAGHERQPGTASAEWSIYVACVLPFSGPTDMKEFDSKIDDLLVEWEARRCNGGTADPAELF